MIKIPNSVKTFLSDKRVTSVILAVSIVSRVIQLIFFFNIGMDASFQFIAMKNLVEGHSISLDLVLPSDLSTIIYPPLSRWPPGYSLLLVPLYLLFGKNYVAAGLTLSILGGITLIFITRKILKVLNVPLYLINIYTLIAGFFIYQFYFIASSDGIAIPLFFVAVYYAVSLLKNDNSWKRKTLFITATLFACGTIKYLFVPIVFIIPAFLILKGHKDNRTQILKSGIYSFFALILALGIMLGYLKYTSGSAGYISAPGRGFFPGHLFAEYPFGPSSFIRSETIGLLFPNNPSLERVVYHIFQGIHLLFLGAIVFVIIKQFWRGGIKGTHVTQSFFYISAFTCLALTGLLATLSLCVEQEIWDNGYRWTYIEDQRYYGACFVFMHLGVFVAYTYYFRRKWRSSKYLFYFLFLLLLTEASRGMVFTAHRILKLKYEEYSWQYECRFQKYADQIIKKEKQERLVVVTGSVRYFNNRVSLYSHVPILLDAAKINEPGSLKTEVPVLLLVILRQNNLSGFQPFLATKEKELAGHFDDFYFYKLYVSPQ